MDKYNNFMLVLRDKSDELVTRLFGKEFHSFTEMISLSKRLN